MTPATARRTLKRHVRIEAEAEALRRDLLPALRAEGESRFGSVAAFAEAVAAHAGVKAQSVRNRLYTGLTAPMLDAALDVLGFMVAAETAQPEAR